MTDSLLNQVINEDPELIPDINYFDSLVGEERRYKSGDELARGKLNADKQIKTLEDEVHVARERNIVLKDLVEGFRNTDDDAEVTPPAQETPSTTIDVEKVVENTLERKEQERTLKENEQLSLRLLDEQLGSRSQTSTTLKTLFDTNPELIDTMSNLSATNPQAFIKLFNSYTTPNQPAVSAPGTIGGPSANAIIATTGSRGYSYYEEMHKTDPKKFRSQAIQDEMVAMAAKAEAEGRDFFNS